MQDLCVSKELQETSFIPSKEPYSASKEPYIPSMEPYLWICVLPNSLKKELPYFIQGPYV